MVSVCNNGVDIAPAGMEFVFMPTPSVSRIVPSVRGLGSTAIVVTLFGSHFSYSDGLSCRFGHTAKVSAVWLTSTMLECGVGSHSLAGNLTVEVSNNGETFSTNRQLLATQGERRVSSVVPSLSWVKGSSMVTVYGRGFDGKSGYS